MLLEAGNWDDGIAAAPVIIAVKAISDVIQRSHHCQRTVVASVQLPANGAARCAGLLHLVGSVRRRVKIIANEVGKSLQGGSVAFLLFHRAQEVSDHVTPDLRAHAYTCLIRAAVMQPAKHPRVDRLVRCLGQ